MQVYGGAIKDNSVTDAAGGIFIRNNSFLTINGGEISNNIANVNGGGVYVYNDSTIVFAGGEISNNNAGQYCGGVYVNGGSYFVMTDGKIVNNTAKADGGGVCVYRSIFEMTGGEILNNTANSKGGGVLIAEYYSTPISFTVFGGEVSPTVVSGITFNKKGAAGLSPAAPFYFYIIYKYTNFGAYQSLPAMEKFLRCAYAHNLI